MSKRLLSMLLCLVMVLAMVPVQAQAADDTTDAAVITDVMADAVPAAGIEAADGIIDIADAVQGTAANITVEPANTATETEDWYVDEYGNYFFTSLEGLKELLKIDSDSPYGYAYLTYENTEDLVITEDITIPDNVSVTVNSFDADNPVKCIIAEDVTVTVSQMAAFSSYYLTIHGKLINQGMCGVDTELQINGKFLNYKRLNIGAQAKVTGVENLSFKNDSAYVLKLYVTRDMSAFLESVEAANALPEHWQASIFFQRAEDVVLSQSINIPEKAQLTLQFDPSATLTVPEDCKITLEKNSLLISIGNINVNGAIENAGEISQQDPSVMKFGENGTYSGNGKWSVIITNDSGKTLEDMVVGLDFNELNVRKEEYPGLTRWVIRSKSAVTKLSKPGSVKASASETTGLPIITWKAVEDAESYNVYRSTKKSSGFKKIGTATGTGFVDGSAKVGKKYYYKVEAVCGDVVSAKSSAKSATCVCAAPAVEASNTASSGKLKLKWSKVTSAKKYEIYRSTKKSSGFKKIGSTTKTYYTDSSAKVGTTYYYKVKAIASKSSYNSAYSQILKAKRICAQPDLTVKVASSGKPSLSWDKVSGAKEYKIFRADTKDGEYTLIKTTTSTSYTDKTAEFDKDYWYQVDVVGSKSGTDNDTEAPVSVHTTCAKPSVSVELSKKKPLLSWGEVEGAIQYDVYRATSKSGKYKKVATVTDATSYRDATAKKGKTYYYKVKAIAANADANSAYSSVDKIKSK